jgi:hypothetical protein
LYLNCEREYMLADRRLLIEDAAISEMHRARRQRSAAPWVCIRNAAAGETPVTVTDGGDGLLVATMPAHGSKLGLGFVQAELCTSWAALSSLHSPIRRSEGKARQKPRCGAAD